LTPKNSTVPLGQNATFLCTSKELIYWEVILDSDPKMRRTALPPRESDQGPMQTLATFISGLFIHSTEDGSSHLIVEGSESNNLTVVKCTIASGGGVGFDNSTPASLRVFGNSII
jgi:hypothetical protein